VKKTLAGESGTADTETVDGWKNDQLMEGTKEYNLCDIYNADETRLFLNLQPIISLTFCGNICYGGTIKIAGFWCSLYVYSAGSSNKLPPLVTGKYTRPCCFKTLKNFPQNMMPIQIPA